MGCLAKAAFTKERKVVVHMKLYLKLKHIRGYRLSMLLQILRIDYHEYAVASILCTVCGV